MLFTIGVLVMVSLWVPTVPSEPPEQRGPRPWISLPLLGILVVGTAITVLALPASGRVRMILGALLLGSTLLALGMESPIRRWLGAPWWP